MRNRFDVNGKKIVLAGALLVMGALPMMTQTVSATPATLGFYPSTDIYGKGIFHFDADTYGKGLRTDALVSNGLTYGIGPETSVPFGRSEIGLDYILSLGGTTPTSDVGSRVLGNIKTQLYNNDDSATRVVAGVWGIGSKDIFAPNVGYLLAAKTFEFGRVHLGVARSFSNSSTIAAPSGSDDKTSLQLGYDRYFLNNKLQFAVDFYSGKNAYSGIQPTLYYYINDKSNIGVGYFRTNDKSVTPSRNQVYLCFDYNFGGPPAAPAAAPVPETVPDAPAAN